MQSDGEAQGKTQTRAGAQVEMHAQAATHTGAHAAGRAQGTAHVEVCFSPGLFADVLSDDFVVVLVDILRATTTICTAVANGVQAIIPVATHEEARRLKEQGYLVASEKDGVQLDFADFGNSAFSFTADRVAGRTLVYCTTNGTRALHRAADGGRAVAVGAFINISTLTDWLVRRRQDVVVLCSGWKNRFCLEDSLFAGALVQRLLATGAFRTECDSAEAAMDLWRAAEADALGYLDKAAQRHRLRRLGLDDVIPYSFECDRVTVVPVFDGRAITADVS